jgi:uncharacterized protein (TIGR03067 family)
VRSFLHWPPVHRRSGSLEHFKLATEVIMFRTLLSGLLVLSLGLLTAAAAQEGKAVTKDLKKVEGSWTVVELEFAGQKLPAENLKELDIKLVVMKDGKYAQKIKGEVKEEGTLKLDPSKKPATVDLNITSGDDKGKLQLGIYELKGDTWRLSLARPGDENRPTAFDAGVMTLKRDKK